MEKQAIEIVRDYVLKHLDKSDAPVKRFKTGSSYYLPPYMMVCITN